MSFPEKLAYRPDIDGLRAFAVISVVVFHAFPKALPGGFLGVDIFFVISGYLISGILFDSLQLKKWSLLEFYSKRVRRIFPALITVLIFCMISGYFLLYNEELRHLGKHVSAGSGFVSNFMLWREAGYFDEAAQLKPLLHLWSLGIEEQFYIVWPCVLYLAWKKLWRPWMLFGTLFIISFTLNLITIRHHADFAFYAPVTRGWELLLGGMLAYFIHQAQPNFAISSWLNEAMAAIGLLLLIYSVIFLGNKKVFPSAWTLLPTFGVLLVILAKDSRANRYILGHRLMVGVGLISYPLYLWHWPLLSYQHIIFSNQASAFITALLLAASVLLAIFTYQWIEKPLRFYRGGNQFFPVGFLCVSLILVGTLGFGLQMRDWSQSNRLVSAEELPLLEQKQFYEYKNHTLPCALNTKNTDVLSICYQMQATKPTKAVWGDSHAEHLLPGLLSQDKQNNWLVIGHTSCPPILDVEIFKTGRQSVCAKNNDIVLEALLNTPSIDTVVLASLGPFYIQDTGFAFEHLEENSPAYWQVLSRTEPHGKLSKAALFYRGMDAAITALEAHGKHVILYHDIPEVSFMPSHCLKRPLAINTQRCALDRETVLARQASYHALLMDLKAIHPNIEIFDPNPYLCDKHECYVRKGGQFIYRDSHHLSAYGSELLAKPFLAWLSENRLS